MDKFLKSKFKTGQKLGENPFSLTYSGTTLSGEQPVIIKIYKRGTLNSSLIKSMKQKVKMLGDFIHPRIVKILDGDYGWQGFYYVRPYVKGQSLDEVMKAQKLTLDQAEEILFQVCEALAAAHKRGIVHASLKPSNVILDRDGVKLVDFVIEGEVKESIPQKAESILEGYENLSPEELSGCRATMSSDIFAAGVMFYKMLTGKNPFKNQLNRLHAVYDPPQGVPRYVEDIIKKALEPDPLLRFKNISDLVQSLKVKTILEPQPEFNLPQIALENTPHPKEKEVQTIKKDREKNFFFAILVLIAVIAGIIYAVITTMLTR